VLISIKRPARASSHDRLRGHQPPSCAIPLSDDLRYEYPEIAVQTHLIAGGHRESAVVDGDPTTDMFLVGIAFLVLGDS